MYFYLSTIYWILYTNCRFIAFTFDSEGFDEVCNIDKDFDDKNVSCLTSRKPVKKTSTKAMVENLQPVVYSVLPAPCHGQECNHLFRWQMIVVKLWNMATMMFPVWCWQMRHQWCQFTAFSPSLLSAAGVAVICGNLLKINIELIENWTISDSFIVPFVCFQSIR